MPNRPDLLLPEALTNPWLAAALVGAAALCVGLHFLKPLAARFGWPAALPFFFVRSAAATGAVWLALQLASRFINLTSAVPLWGIAALGGFSLEAVVALYAHERTLLGRGRRAFVLAARLGAMLILLGVIAQPIWSRMAIREVRRDLAILVDDSESMQMQDESLPVPAKLAVAEMFGEDAASWRFRLRESATAFANLAAPVEAGLADLGETPDAETLDARADPLSQVLVEAGEKSLDLVTELARPLEKGGMLPKADAERLAAIQRAARTEIPARLARAHDALLGGDAANLRGHAEAALELMRAAAADLPAMADRADDAFFKALSDPEKAAVDKAAAQMRSAVARRAIAEAPPGRQALLAALRERFNVRLYLFGQSAREIDAASWAAGSRNPALPPEPGESEAEGAAEPESAPSSTAAAAAANANIIRLVAAGSACRALPLKDAAAADEPSGWRDQAFDDAGWRAGENGAGYGFAFDQAAEQGLALRPGDAPAGALLRLAFAAPAAAEIESLALRVACNDGFIAWLNGTEIARMNAPNAEPADGVETAEIDLTGALADLDPTKNVLAVRALNAPGQGADAFYFFAELTGSRAGAPAEAEGGADFRKMTDVTSALGEVFQSVPSDSLAGVLIASDGRHNGPRRPEEIARRLGAQNSPIVAMPIGGEIGPRDAAVLNVRAAESIYLGDKVSVRANVKLDGMRGEQVKAWLYYEGQQVDEKVIDVADDPFRTEVRFSHIPPAHGIYSYEVRLAQVEDELFPNNNAWRFETAVTDDRTNVLLVDSFPRWEFRYLRNLFYARDKSVHLQYVLLAPDQIEGFPPSQPVAASAARPFGEAEAQILPQGREEWLKFDAIILGDIPPNALAAETWDDIEHCVADRGALLVCIAGPRFMPHAFGDERFLEMMPMEFDSRIEPYFGNQGGPFKIAPTPEGLRHLIMEQSPSPAINAQLWDALPEASWRHPVAGVKESAEVLAYAAPPSARPGDPPPDPSFMRQNALLAVQRYATGRTAMLAFDQTWRLRYGVGDTLHHKFWGQMLRWGTGENLRAGTEHVRVGSDRLAYTPQDKITIMAKVIDENFTPIADDNVSVAIYRDGKRVMRKRLTYRPASNGIYEATLDPFAEPGRYRLELEGDQADRMRIIDGADKVETEFLVVGARNPVELAELSADPAALSKLAALSGGATIALGDALAALAHFDGEPEKIKEQRNTTLWDNPFVLAAFVLLLAGEWIARRRAGLT